MPSPVIDVTTSILAYRKDEFFVYQPAATETPTSWACLGLPTGITINTTTGRISGAATEPGVYNCTLTAINGTGTSLPLFLAMGIESSGFDNNSAIELDINLATGELTNPATKAGEPILFGKKGDTLLISVGFMKAGYLLDIPIAQIDLGVKEFEPESLLKISDGTYRKTGSYDTTRYLFFLQLTPAVFASILSNYEKDEDTFVDARAEIRWAEVFLKPGATIPAPLERSSATFDFRIARDIAPDIA